MIYEHRSYYILPGKLPEFTEVFGTLIPIFEKYGAKLIGAWQNAVGQNNEFIYILGFEDLNQREKFWQDFRQDEKFKQYQREEPRVSYLVSRILRPTSYSPLK